MKKSDIKHVIEKLEPDSEMKYRLSQKMIGSRQTRIQFRPIAAVAAGLAIIVGTGVFANYQINNSSKNTKTGIVSSANSIDSRTASIGKTNEESKTDGQNSGVDTSKTVSTEGKTGEEVKAIEPDNKPGNSNVKAPENKPGAGVNPGKQNGGSKSSKPQSPDTPIVKDPNKGIYIPKVNLPENTGVNAKMIGLIVYQGRIYIQNSLQLAPDAAEKLIGEKIGTTKSNITEWSKQDDYAVELASTVGIQDVYTVKGYDKSFRIMTCEKINGEVYSFFFECLNGITVSTGNDVFGKFKIENNVESVKYENFDSWNNGKLEYKSLIKFDGLNNFLKVLESSVPNTRESVSYLFDDQSAAGQKFIYIKLNDGSEVQLRLFKDGYVYYNGADMFFKVDDAAFKSFWNEIE